MNQELVEKHFASPEGIIEEASAPLTRAFYSIPWEYYSFLFFIVLTAALVRQTSAHTPYTPEFADVRAHYEVPAVEGFAAAVKESGESVLEPDEELVSEDSAEYKFLEPSQAISV